MAAATVDRRSNVAGWLERLLLLAGILLFLALLRRLGLQAVVAHLLLVGWGIVALLAQEVLVFAANTAGGWAAFRKPRPRIPVRPLLAARIAGDAVNYLAPVTLVGGEVVRTRLLMRHAPPVPVIASVAVAKLTQIIGLLVFLSIGMATVVDPEVVPAAIRTGVAVGLVVLATLLWLLLIGQRRGMLLPLARSVGRLVPQTQNDKLRDPLERIDSEISAVHRHEGSSVLLSSALFFLGWALGLVETYLLLLFLGAPVTLQMALTVEVLRQAIANLFFFVPMRAGAQEAGVVLIFSLLGLDDAKGLAAAILYRVRELFWAGIGLALWWRHRRRAPSWQQEARGVTT